MSYLEHFKNPIDQTVRARVSCRTYENRLLGETHKKELLDFCKIMTNGLNGEKIVYQLVEFSVEELKEKKIAAYGLFKNARSFLVGIIDRSDSYHMSYGYAVEHIVLKATELGVGTCWAGYFEPFLIRDVKIAGNQTVPAIILVGYAAEKQTLLEKIGRFAIRAAKRHDWDKLYFHEDFNKVLTPEEAGPYREALELLHLAPSSGNTQPWRVVKEKGPQNFHFFKKAVNPRYEEKRLHDIDVGIAMCHFELGATKNNLRGKWDRIDPRIPNLPPKTEYMVTWLSRG